MSSASLLDTFLTECDTVLRALFPPVKRVSGRLSPAEHLDDAMLSPEEKKHIAGLMRVNHSGEVCAQALYQGQALTAQLSHVKQQMAEAAAEEVDHLAWCEERLTQLGSKPSLLNPLWYAGSIVLGAIAGFAGDKVSLGFVAETERQVTEHLKKHSQQIPAEDKKTRAILQQMQADEESHANQAVLAGAMDLPAPIKLLMTLVSKVMTRTSYYC